MGERGEGAFEVTGPGQPAIPGLNVVEFESHSGPIPHPLVLQGYEDVSSGLANRIVTMAEKSLQAQIDVDVIPIKAEARALVIATIAVAYLPWLLVAATVVLVALGYHGAAIGTGIASGVTAGPSIIQATRKALEPEHDEKPAARKPSGRSRNARKRR